MKLSIVIPVYNEVDNISSVLAEFCSAGLAVSPDTEILVIDDGSTDGSAGKILESQHKWRNISLIRHSTNQGYGATLRSGLKAARGEYIFFTDGDGQFSAE